MPINKLMGIKIDLNSYFKEVKTHRISGFGYPLPSLLKTGFLDPLMISQACYKEVARRHGEEYKDLDDAEFEKAVKQNQRKKMKVMAAYIGQAMYNHVQHGKDLIIAPHHFK